LISPVNFEKIKLYIQKYANKKYVEPLPNKNKEHVSLVKASKMLEINTSTLYCRIKNLKIKCVTHKQYKLISPEDLEKIKNYEKHSPFNKKLRKYKKYKKIGEMSRELKIAEKTVNRRIKNLNISVISLPGNAKAISPKDFQKIKEYKYHIEGLKGTRGYKNQSQVCNELSVAHSTIINRIRKLKIKTVRENNRSLISPEDFNKIKNYQASM